MISEIPAIVYYGKSFPTLICLEKTADSERGHRITAANVEMITRETFPDPGKKLLPRKHLIRENGERVLTRQGRKLLAEQRSQPAALRVSYLAQWDVLGVKLDYSPDFLSSEGHVEPDLRYLPGLLMNPETINNSLLTILYMPDGRAWVQKLNNKGEGGMPEFGLQHIAVCAALYVKYGSFEPCGPLELARRTLEMSGLRTIELTDEYAFHNLVVMSQHVEALTNS